MARQPFTELVSATSTAHGFRVLIANETERREIQVSTSELLNFRKFRDVVLIVARRVFLDASDQAGDAAQDRWSEAVQAALAVGRREREEKDGEKPKPAERKTGALGRKIEREAVAAKR